MIPTLTLCALNYNPRLSSITMVHEFKVLRQGCKWFYKVPFELVQKIQNLKFNPQEINDYYSRLEFTEGDDGYIYLKNKTGKIAPLVNLLPHFLSANLEAFFGEPVPEEIRLKFISTYNQILPQLPITEMSMRFKNLSAKYPHLVSESHDIDSFEEVFTEHIVPKIKSIRAVQTWKSFKLLSTNKSRWVINNLRECSPWIESMVLNFNTCPGLMKHLFNKNRVKETRDLLLSTHTRQKLMIEALSNDWDVIDFKKPNKYIPPIQIEYTDASTPLAKVDSREFYNESYMDKSNIIYTIFLMKPSILQTLLFIEYLSGQQFIEQLPNPGYTYNVNPRIRDAKTLNTFTSETQTDPYTATQEPIERDLEEEVQRDEGLQFGILALFGITFLLFLGGIILSIWGWIRMFSRNKPSTTMHSHQNYGYML